MKIYSVGGAVRDELLGLTVKDHDYVVVGATPEEMVKLGYKPVGKDFPVFLHPQTKQEYALARTERKTAPGYKGFVIHAAPDVTLEQDLARRDFTINAIAKDEAGKLIDPFGGATDLKAGVLKHVSDAFAEDPVRILRAARFAARFDFHIAPETLVLMRAMVEKGEADALVPERVWQEFARGLMEKMPLRMFGVLLECGALASIAPELDAHLETEDTASLEALDAAAQANAPLTVRFAVLTRALDPLAVEALCSRLKVPGDCRDLALLATRHGNLIADAASLDARALLELFDVADAWRRPERFGLLMDAALIGEADNETEAQDARARLERALKAALGVDAGAIAKLASDPEQIGINIDAARLDAIKRALG